MLALFSCVLLSQKFETVYETFFMKKQGFDDALKTYLILKFLFYT